MRANWTADCNEFDRNGVRSRFGGDFGGSLRQTRHISVDIVDLFYCQRLIRFATGLGMLLVLRFIAGAGLGGNCLLLRRWCQNQCL